ncbi:MAG: undecaprenyl/decaprenyl-phosphate alpha-N-acetylglucosaminyl 1-phosphate transferase [candidate division KSB1 bacterium]|nr:undecaprenyl/decaprenyl-phosphate alpha-N-acetylglucosaminyl 1-phosphate transferase [candidate division KSB1 bacterium]MDZ7385955.1 undecaprenyl/decaprenyl-phosphate alpha-N-acetylglucosaminyl 1-phosphate transferase [candidate division KSB1 bacterium]MDZ7393921.1 undecaprenyl/decaprenyl-phosphate alpha-N-acetylglucosaminyl 1-phosphate transferase [candidate division KSB1 bacterium]MDZ7413816.1 undecaprenyl/decaprenyl-phosphate alpha-N-acetylglucosaminyl 1-phosphate transferase [candidate di
MSLEVRALLYLYVLLSALVMALALVPLCRRLAFHFEVLDRPISHKQHERPMPLLGGIAIYAAFALTVGLNLALFFALRTHLWVAKYLGALVEQVPHLLRVMPKVVGILVGATVVTALGTVDDIAGIHFSPRLKLAGQTLGAAVAIAVGIRTSFMPGVVLDYFISAVWIVGITNSFNLLDNTDGAAAGIGAIAGAILLFVVALQGQVFTALMLAALVGALLGFLRHNFYPATIFMGDAGSLFIGYVLACLTLVGSYVVPGSPGLLPVILPLLVLGVPLFDTFSVVYIRLREKRPIWVGDRCHFSHRLMDLGMSPKQAVLFLYLVTFGVGLGAALLPSLNYWQSGLVLVNELVIFAIIVSLMHIGRKGRA